MAYNNELNTAFRWYINSSSDNSADTALRKKHSNKGGYSDSFKLLMQAHSMNPFQFLIPVDRVTTQSNNVLVWRIVKKDITDPLGALSGGDYIDVYTAVTTSPYVLSDYMSIVSVVNKGLYVSGCHKINNVNSPGKAFPFKVPQGDWYSVLHFQDGTVAVSEDFYIPCDVTGDGETDSSYFAAEDMIRIDWLHDSDLFNLFYQQTDSVNGFRNRLWLKGSDFQENEPTFIEEGIENGVADFIQQKAIFLDNYQMKEFLPEWLYRALMLTRGHNSVIVWGGGYLYYAFMKVKECTMQWSDSGIDGTVTIKFSQADTKLIKSGCGTNMQLGSSVPLKANADEIKLFPRAGAVPGFNVMTNDTGLGMSVIQIVNYEVGASNRITLYPNGTLSVNSAVNYTLGAVLYTLVDIYGSTPSQAALTIRWIDWVPTEDIWAIWGGALLMGQRVFDFGTKSVFDNDVYPINVNAVTCVNGLFFSNLGTGNYVQVTTQGTIIYRVVNPVLTDRFLLHYYNSITGTFKMQNLTINAV